MSVTVTDTFKRFLVDEVYDDFYNTGKDSVDPTRSKYFVGIGRTQAWEFPDSDLSPPIVSPSLRDSKSFMEDLQSVQLCEDASRVAPRYNWSNGSIYSGWNDDYHSNLVFAAGQQYQHPFYVITSSNRVYVCIKSGIGTNGLRTNSTVRPTDITGDTFQTADGYQWRYLYTVGTNDTRKFLTSGYIPSNKILDSSEGGPVFDDLDPFQQEHLAIQKKAVPGEVIGVEIESPGSGFVDGQYELEFVAVPLILDGAIQTVTDARAWATVSGGKITDVTMKDPVAIDTYHFGKNYYDASVKFVLANSGIGYKLRPIVSHARGIASDASKDLNSTAIMFNVILDGTGNNNFVVENDFRQVGLIKNLEQIDSDGSGNLSTSQFTATKASLLDKIKYNVADVGVSLFTENITGDNILTGAITGATAILHTVEEDMFTYSQSSTTGYKNFQVGEPLEVSNGGGITSVVAIEYSTVSKETGDVYYIDSRRPFMRSVDQTEDIKIVIDF